MHAFKRCPQNTFTDKPYWHYIILCALCAFWVNLFEWSLVRTRPTVHAASTRLVCASRSGAHGAADTQVEGNTNTTINTTVVHFVQVLVSDHRDKMSETIIAETLCLAAEGIII